MTVVAIPDPEDEAYIKGFDFGQREGWRAALGIYGLRNCTIRNDGDIVMRVPIGSYEGYLDLDPGEQATIRTVEAVPDWMMEPRHGWPEIVVHLRASDPSPADENTPDLPATG